MNIFERIGSKLGPKTKAAIVGKAALMGTLNAEGKGLPQPEPFPNDSIQKVITHNPKDSLEGKNAVPYSFGNLENKNYKIKAIPVTEKNGQIYMLLRLEKKGGEYASYEEVINAVKEINPDIRFLTPEETQNLLNGNMEAIPKASSYVALGADVTGSPVDVKASGGSGTEFSAFMLDRGRILSAGSNSPSDNGYYFPAVGKDKNMQGNSSDFAKAERK
ncbi:MAG TPA: hypothetical protein VG694_01945 [Candidatus Paceibacterota bacterium]|jgi:hypothetical protein|nr:hypothetical protein [Candidatus Paceibacterota bacterium]